MLQSLTPEPGIKEGTQRQFVWILTSLVKVMQIYQKGAYGFELSVG